MKIPLKRYFTILSDYLAHQKLGFSLLCVLLLSSIGIQVLNPQIMRYFIDATQTQTEGRTLLLVALLFLFTALLQQALAVGASYQGSCVGWSATNALREDLLRHTLRLDMRFHKEKSGGEFIERIEGDVTAFNVFFSQLVLRVFGNLLLLFGILIALFFIDPLLGGAFTLFSLVTLCVLNAVRSIAIPKQKAFRDAETSLFSFIEERLAGTEDIRALGAVDYVLARLYSLHAIIHKKWRAATLMNFVITLCTGLLILSGTVLAIFMSYTLMQRGLITLGTVYLIIHYINLVGRPIREISQQLEGLQNIGASIERMDELLNTKSTLEEIKEAKSIEKEALRLDFKQVSFQYEADEKPVIQDLSFSLLPGKTLGLLGRTGGGKTTLVRLVFRLYDPTAGTIELNGVNLKEIKHEDLRNKVAYVTQDVQLFQANVRDNITFFAKDVPDEKLLSVIHTLGLTPWLASLPEGLDTRLSSGGKSLSAGEAQLLALCRVFLKDPSLIILDEASSRLDPATEQLMERAMDRVLKGRTAIIVAHRLSTIKRADEIMILQEGTVAEYGARETLLEDPDSKFSHLHLTGLEAS